MIKLYSYYKVIMGIRPVDSREMLNLILNLKIKYFIILFLLTYCANKLYFKGSFLAELFGSYSKYVERQ